MIDIKSMLELTGLKVSEEYFKKAPLIPYIVYTVEEDSRPLILERNIRVELYTDKIEKVTETRIEQLLKEKEIEYSKSRQWIEKDSFLSTVFEFDLIEKVR